jgi:hypothetical protein
MMHQIFNNTKKPFYSSTKNINLKKIDKAIYVEFIKFQFEKHKFKINDENIDLILELTDCHTYYTQRLCHDIFAFGEKKINNSLIIKTINNIVSDNESIYYQYRNLITTSQWNLLKSIAIEKKVEQIYAQKFIYKYNLGTSANVKRIIEALMEKEMVYFNASIENPFYEINDKFLMYWLQNK